MMASIVPNLRRIRSFGCESAFEAWISAHHDREPEVLIKIHKKSSGLPSVTPAQALDVVLCWSGSTAPTRVSTSGRSCSGITPRGRKSRWSQINREHVARLVAAGRMTPHGQRQIDAAKADGLRAI